MTDDTIGIDISKATLDIHRLSDGKTMSFSNCPAGFKALSRFCAKTAVARVVYEATGAYHGGLERALGAHLPLVKVNPLQARRFAQAQGVRAKTDAVDAKILAEMGNAFALEPDEPASEIQRDLKELRAFRCVCRGDPPTDSDLMRPPVPISSAHRFRGMRPPL